MKAHDIPHNSDSDRATFSLGSLLDRASSKQRQKWTDLPPEAGIYVVCWTSDREPVFKGTASEAKHAVPADPRSLRLKWKRINHCELTDIIYVGKGGNLRERVRALARFGVGKARNHRGGEWMWQIADISGASVLLQKCPRGKEVPLENWLLERFWKEHKDWPLANREGPEGPERWCPGEE